MYSLHKQLDSTIPVLSPTFNVLIPLDDFKALENELKTIFPNIDFSLNSGIDSLLLAVAHNLLNRIPRETINIGEYVEYCVDMIELRIDANDQDNSACVTLAPMAIIELYSSDFYQFLVKTFELFFNLIKTYIVTELYVLTGYDILENGQRMLLKIKDAAFTV